MAGHLNGASIAALGETVPFRVASYGKGGSMIRAL